MCESVVFHYMIMPGLSLVILTEKNAYLPGERRTSADRENLSERGRPQIQVYNSGCRNSQLHRSVTVAVTIST